MGDVYSICIYYARARLYGSGPVVVRGLMVADVVGAREAIYRSIARLLFFVVVGRQVSAREIGDC